VNVDPPVWENYAAKAMRREHVESDADRAFSVTISRPDF
jgi:hypothetical protein